MGLVWYPPFFVSASNVGPDWFCVNPMRVGGLRLADKRRHAFFPFFSLLSLSPQRPFVTCGLSQFRREPQEDLFRLCPPLRRDSLSPFLSRRQSVVRFFTLFTCPRGPSTGPPKVHQSCWSPRSPLALPLLPEMTPCLRSGLISDRSGPDASFGSCGWFSFSFLLLSLSSCRR